MTRSTPVFITIPRISVHADLMKLHLTPKGALEVPPGAFPAGWYVGSPTSGERGPSVIVGHVHWNGRAGVFARLAELKPHDKITVLRADGRNAVFEITAVKLYAKDHFPSALVYGNVEDSEIRLITCGRYDPVARKYEANLVVFASLVQAGPRRVTPTPTAPESVG